MKPHVTVHERSKPAPAGVTLHSTRLAVVVGTHANESGHHDELGRIKVRTFHATPRDSFGDGHLAIDRIDFVHPRWLSEFAHGILRVIGEEQ